MAQQTKPGNLASCRVCGTVSFVEAELAPRVCRMCSENSGKPKAKAEGAQLSMFGAAPALEGQSALW